jgi:succinylglutamate desuccinylase
MKINKIFVVACTHGDEVFGLKVLAHLRKITPGKEVVLHIAHPEAVTKRKRYIETDLNRSFMLEASESSEAGIAHAIVADINKFDPELIIDLHTSTVDVGKVAILAENNALLINAAKHLNLQRIAVMPHKIASKSLIGVFPERSLCIEYGKSLRSDSLAENLARKINGLTELEADIGHIRLPLFVVERIIEKIEANELKLTNYEFNEKLAGYPFLTGEDNYSEHRGFLATSQIEV